MKPRYDTTQLKSHPKRNRKQNELVKTMLKHLDLMLGENHAGEFLAIFVDLLKRAVNETPDGRLELRSLEIILNDYFHAKHSADGTWFKVNADHKKLKAFEIIKKDPQRALLISDYKDYDEYIHDKDPYWIEKELMKKDEFDLLKEVMK